jgi:RNA polymerase sigma-70 factor (ECF subfamily)
MKTKTEEKIIPNLEEVILKFWPQINYRTKSSLGYYNLEWEDVASEILLNVVEAIKKNKFRGESSIGTFIYKITSRRIIDYIRKKGRFPKHLPEPNHSLDPYDYVLEKEQSELLSRSIKKLKPKYADMLYLFYYMGMSQTEIARTYGISTGRVSVLIKEARKSLKKIIQD